MPTTDTSERGLEELIVNHLTGHGDTSGQDNTGIREHGLVYDADYVLGDPKDYDRQYAIDTVKLFAFLNTTQPSVVETLSIGSDGPSRTRFLGRLQGEITKRGIVDVLRHGVKHGPATVNLFYGTPTPGNIEAARLFAENIFSVTRQLRYSRTEDRLALDLAIFINGLPVATFELKNSLTKQTVADAIRQYQQDRDPRELIFQPGRCVAHFALDDHEVRFCTALRGTKSQFLPFNQGWNDGAGNPPNPNGIKTDYLWKRILTRRSLTDIIENYAQRVEEKDANGKKKAPNYIFPRYHQLDVVRKLLAHAGEHGSGQRYLIQHSAGSGKSNSIAWLAHQLVELRKGDRPIFDSVVVVTDRKVLDAQIQSTIKQYASTKDVIGHADSSADLRHFLASGKKIIITTVQKFPFVLDGIGDSHRTNRFAIIIDEAHSSQGGRTASKMNQALSETPEPEEEDAETIEDLINRAIETRRMLPNASYFAFTATPKNKTLEMFGTPVQTEGGKVGHRPFHTYSMKQAIEEGFIMDVLANYTPIKSYYRLTRVIEDDPEFDTRKAQKKLKQFVEGHQHAIRQKAEIMVDHFHDQVLAKNKVGGKARAIVATSSIRRAIEYYAAISAYLIERRSPIKAIVAFSGEPEWEGRKVTEASFNGFPSNKIPEMFREEPYRILVVANKFLTGYDEPLLHTMYVDKQLSGVQAVQTLSRLNRAHPAKTDTFVLDFYNDVDEIEAAFAPYYRTTILSEETDPNKLHDLQADLDAYQVYSDAQIDQLVERYLRGAPRDQLDSLLDTSVTSYINLTEDEQIEFKGKAKAFVRTYNFLSSILPYGYAAWEKRSIFLGFLIPRLPSPPEDDLAAGILETIDMESYRLEMGSRMSIALADEDAEIGPVPTGAAVVKPEPEFDRLSNIIKSFNEQFGNIDWKDPDKIRQVITEELPAKVAADRAYQNAMAQGDRQNARVEHDRALSEAILGIIADHTELFKQFSDNDAFKRWLSDTTFDLTYENTAPQYTQESAWQSS